MSTFVLLFTIIFSYNLSNGCDYFYPDPIQLTLANRVDNITIGEILEMSFELQLHETCQTGYCHLLRIFHPDGSGYRLPMLNIPASNGAIRAIFSDSNSLTSKFESTDPNLLSVYHDGNYHRYYFKWSATERIFIFDDIVYENITNGSYDSSKYTGGRYGLYITDATPVLNGSIRNLCINSSWYADTDPNECVFYHKNPIDIFKDNKIGDVTIEDTIELSFDIQTNVDWTCSSGWCNVIRIGLRSQTFPRFPLIAILPAGAIHFSSSTDVTSVGYDLGNESFTPINDGNYHRMYFKISFTQRIFTYDHTNTFQIDDPSFTYSTYIGSQYSVLVCGDNVHPVVEGNIKNLCFNTYTQTNAPTMDPTLSPTKVPTTSPTPAPTKNPTNDPTVDPTKDPTNDPSGDPTSDPTNDPTKDPTQDPTKHPTMDPTIDPTNAPTTDPTEDPTRDPTTDPTNDPTTDPTTDPTLEPTQPTHEPTLYPTRYPTTDPTKYPTYLPTYDPTKPIGEAHDDTTTTDESEPTKDVLTNKDEDLFGIFDNLIVYIFGGAMILLFCCICLGYCLMKCKRGKRKRESENGDNRLQRIKSLSSSNINMTEMAINVSSVETPRTPQFEPVPMGTMQRRNDSDDIYENTSSPRALEMQNFASMSQFSANTMTDDGALIGNVITEGNQIFTVPTKGMNADEQNNDGDEENNDDDMYSNNSNVVTKGGDLDNEYEHQDENDEEEEHDEDEYEENQDDENEEDEDDDLYKPGGQIQTLK